MNLRLRHNICGLLLAVAGICAAASAPQEASGTLSRTAELRATISGQSSPRVLVAAHRADWRNFPENSLPAIESALRLGVDIIEIDVARTRDGEFIIMHDATLDRTTTGHGRVIDHTMAEIRNLRLRNGCGIATDYGVPTLEEALLAVKGRALVNLDKSYQWLGEYFPLLERTGTTAQVIVKSYDLPAERVLAEHAERLRQVIYMPIVSFKKPNAAILAQGHFAKVHPWVMEIAFPRWTPEVEETFAAAKASGVRIWANTMWTGLAGDLSDDRALQEPEANYGWLLARGVTLIQTDRPEYLLEYLRRRGLHP